MHTYHCHHVSSLPSFDLSHHFLSGASNPLISREHIFPDTPGLFFVSPRVRKSFFPIRHSLFTALPNFDLPPPPSLSCMVALNHLSFPKLSFLQCCAWIGLQGEGYFSSSRTNAFEHVFYKCAIWLTRPSFFSLHSFMRCTSGVAASAGSEIVRPSPLDPPSETSAFFHKNLPKLIKC